jgi:TRAP-type C4-dicarboxylate transport system substrate-binding protein
MRSHLLIIALSGVVFAAHAEPLQLKFAYPATTATKVYADGIAPWVENVNKDADGTIEFKVFPGPALGNFNNIYDRILNGVVEAAFGTFGSLTGQFPKTDVSGLPFEGENCFEASVAIWRLLEKGVTADEYVKIKPLGLFTFPPGGYQAKKPIRTADDLKGLKVAVFARITAQQVELLGGTPVTMMPTEAYAAMQRGLTNAVGTGWVATQAFKLYEVTDFHLDAQLGQGGAYVFMSKDVYAKLPAAAQRAIDRHSYEKLSAALGKASDAMEEFGRSSTRALPGHTIERLDPKEAAMWKQKLAPITEEWVRATPNGAAVLAAYRAELAAVRAGR